MRALPGQVLRFGLVGLVNTVIGLIAIFTLMYVFRASPVVANAVGYTVGTMFSYGLNRAWTFRDKRSCTASVWRYVTVAGISYFLNLMTVLGTISSAAINAYVAQSFGIGIYTVCMFVGCRWFVYLGDDEADFSARPLSSVE